MLWMGVLKNALQKSVRYPDLQIVDKKYFCKCYNEKVKKKTRIVIVLSLLWLVGSTRTNFQHNQNGIFSLESRKTHGLAS